MLHFRHKSLIILSGILWLAIGVFLLQLGLHLILDSLPTGADRPILRTLANLFGQYESAAVALIAIALMIGFYKGRYVLSRSAQRVVRRLRSHPEPVALYKLYSWPYLALIMLMISLGMLMRFFGVSEEIRGTIDVAIGAALIQGAMFYFRAALEEKPSSSHL